MAVTRRIGTLDYNWLRMDSESTPMHIGALFTFEVPKGAGDDFVGRLAGQMRAQTDFAAPWNLQLRRGVRGALVPSWEENNDLDLDYHFRHSALPRPGGERELGVLVSRLHSNPLDRGRPLWEVHLIEGLAPNRFALYLKIHHSLMDGTSGMRIMLAMMGTKAAAGRVVAPWTIGPSAAPDMPGAAWSRLPNPVPVARAVAEVAWGVGQLVVDDALVAPHAAPESVLSEPMSGQRRFATARVPLALAKEVAAATGGTVNDVVLWLSGTALRRFLLDSGKLPDKSLVGALPVNLRTDGDNEIGTNVAMILASIGTANADPRGRLDEIVASTKAAKAHLNGLSDNGKKAYTMLSSNALVLGQLSKLDHLLPPMFSLAISNVPGPPRPMYFAGAKLDAIHPISLLMRKGRVEHHLRQLRRHDRLRVHRCPRHPAPPAAHRGVRRRGRRGDEETPAGIAAPDTRIRSPPREVTDRARDDPWRPIGGSHGALVTRAQDCDLRFYLVVPAGFEPATFRV